MSEPLHFVPRNRLPLTAIAAKPTPRAATAEERALVLIAPLSRRFILSSFFYLMVGAGVGALYPFFPAAMFPALLLKAHIHGITLGFLTFLIYGMTYHMLPRFCGCPLREGWLTRGHEGLAHPALWLQLAGWLSDQPLISGVGALFSWLAFLLFAGALWPILGHSARQ